MEPGPRIALCLLLPQLLLSVFAEDLECIPGFEQKIFYIEQSSGFRKDQLILNVQFDDCEGNENLNFDVSNQDFKVEEDGSLVALKNVSAVGREIFVHARTARVDDMAEVKILGGKERHSSLKHMLKLPKNVGFLRQKRSNSILVPPVSIPENQRPPFPKTQPGRVTASGMPEGSKFRLSGRGVDQDPKGLFKISEYSGEILVTRALDREQFPNFVLQVEVVDASGKAIDGPTFLNVSVIDQNDNKPIFREASYVGHVLEGSPTGTTVMRMTAFDADDPTTDNAILRYNILKQTPDKPSPNMFYIDPEKGDIVTVVSPALLDRETLSTPQYELIVEAKDMSGSDVGLTGTATATIVIDDKNDYAPEFTKREFQATVNEGVTGVIVNLTVEDKDDPATGAWRAVYTIINGNSGQSFEVHTNAQNNEGMLSVVKPLDYEISAFHTLLIKVENEDPLIPDIAYGPSSTTTVQITVHDVNEGPVFRPDPMVVTKQENIPIGSEVFTLKAMDPDNLQHQTIRYSIHKDPAGWLSINPTNGTIYTTAILDRESPLVHNNTYAVQFLGIDNGSPPATGTGTLHITLEDVNDNAPILSPIVAKVCEDTKEANVVILGASDKDLSPNVDPFRFELSKQSAPDRTWKITPINNTHAQVSLLQNLKKANYNIPVFVTDSGNPPLTSSTDLKVQVCSCKKGKMDCSSADAPHVSLALLLLFTAFSLFCL